jgi:uncharacterized membrane protein YeaQ/YmgE (transglycosylase-associated protein family)
MGLLLWLIVGAIAGWLAGELMRGSGFGIFGDMLVGIVGALIGGFIATAFFGVVNPITGINLSTLLIAFLGSIILVGILRLARGTRVS